MKQSLKQEIRAFNRFYTNIIGLLEKHILNSSYSLPEARILFEIYHHTELTASGIVDLLDIDKGYLSRMLRRLEKIKVIKKVTDASDKRSVTIQLTDKGKKEFKMLDSASNKQIEEVFSGLSEKDCIDLIDKMKKIKLLLNKKNI